MISSLESTNIEIKKYNYPAIIVSDIAKAEMFMRFALCELFTKKGTVLFPSVALLTGLNHSVKQWKGVLPSCAEILQEANRPITQG